ncbi:hypothetical protein ACHHYP_17275 [Achlya hypogyna]|uniref:Uncharacterized protein n=1 Tax=Achlya hypogyna TaxID=1202772 RepID=A0A1V9Y4T1_ACHHY|nr:hypothetical protein ACHHYP_17275 [Achlya hypogyna]
MHEGLSNELSYYTVWNFIVQAVYYIWAIYYQLSHWGARNGNSIAHPRSLNTLFNLVWSHSMLVLVVFWTELYYPTMPWYSYIQHGGNTLLFFVEFAGNHFCVQGSDIVYVAVFPTLYTTFIWISHDTWLNGSWPYEFLNMDTPIAPLWYAGIFAAHFVFFGVACGVSSLKMKFFPQSCSDMGAGSIQGLPDKVSYGAVSQYESIA